jgi:heptaprenyl diphosphate synthase
LTQPIKGTRRVTRLALLTAIALTIFMVEAQIPVPIALPGVKLGLANIVTVYAVFLLGPADALLILVARVFLGAVFSGQMMTLLYSLGGGLLAWLVMVLLSKLLTPRQLWLCSPVAALFHNLGQLLVAAAVLKSLAVLAYLPYLVLAGILTGLFTGLGAQALIRHLDKLNLSPKKD